MRLPRMTTRRWMAAVALLALLVGAVRRASDPLETFHRRTGLGGQDSSRVLATRYGVTFHGEPEFAVVFDVDPAVVSDWASRRPPGGWRGWFADDVPHWVTAMCPVAREAFLDVPIGRSGTSSIRCAFRHSPGCEDRGDLIVVDQSIGRVWFLSWGY